MRIVWLARARHDRTAAIDHIALDSPRAGLEQLDEIESQVEHLATYPAMGRVGRWRGTRELVVVRTPFIVVYRVRSKLRRIEIVRLMHGAQQWLPGGRKSAAT
ncbi:type II toxin-antitoxin system RelE/ParE family toxin [Labrys wisconsinensis]|uniref:Toxin ParE1/3/4 n=1 Tax=Labrys wisconsinensis TaxID=425677 RepID=A0ABU0J7K2_9HYPH|nr:type II toxin-antitoxin system RelE/ParE family toxin [Labrys wisconsinensis]MDQ0470247.1 toxin ParE1/3/4 [Labrys wisconsinensis]